jgi:Ulp1 family protease
VLDVASTRFYYFDSMASGGRGVPEMAKKFAGKMMRCVEKYSRSGEDTSAAATSSSSSSDPSTRSNTTPSIVAPASCPHQTNSSDCGVYALVIAETIAHVRSKHHGVSIGGEDISAALKALSPKEITRKRQEIQATIQKIAAESKR